MSEPLKDCPENVRGILFAAISELISSNSALNMEPEPMEPNKNLEYPSNVFLSNTDFWVNHSVEHINRAMEFINNAIEKINKTI